MRASAPRDNVLDPIASLAVTKSGAVLVGGVPSFFDASDLQSAFSQQPYTTDAVLGYLRVAPCSACPGVEAPFTDPEEAIRKPASGHPSVPVPGSAAAHQRTLWPIIIGAALVLALLVLVAVRYHSRTRIPQIPRRR